MCVLAPGWIEHSLWNEYYSTDAEFLFAIAEAMRPEYRAIIEAGFTAGAYSIEAANPRHEHEWKVWRDVRLPSGKILIPGVVSHASNVVEHPGW